MREQAREAAPLVKLGLAFMLSGFFVLAASYATRIMVVRTVSIEGAGFYQAAWTLGGIYVGFILSAMGADFYPRLAAVADQHGECNSLVNEQIHVGVLMASPGVIVTLALAPIVLPIFYTSDFAMAEPLLRWFCIGMALRVVTWPMGFILVAQGRQRLFLLTDAAWSIVNVVLSWICLELFGLQGAGIAFCAAYVVYGLLFYPIVRALTGFRFSASNKRHMALFGGLIGAVFGACYLLPSIHRAAFGLLVGIAGSFYSARTLAALMPTRRIPRPILRVFTFLRILPKE